MVHDLEDNYKKLARDLADLTYSATPKQLESLVIHTFTNCHATHHNKIIGYFMACIKCYAEVKTQFPDERNQYGWSRARAIFERCRDLFEIEKPIAKDVYPKIREQANRARRVPTDNIFENPNDKTSEAQECLENTLTLLEELKERKNLSKAIKTKIERQIDAIRVLM